MSLKIMFNQQGQLVTAQLKPTSREWSKGAEFNPEFHAGGASNSLLPVWVDSMDWSQKDNKKGGAMVLTPNVKGVLWIFKLSNNLQD